MSRPYTNSEHNLHHCSDTYHSGAQGSIYLHGIEISSVTLTMRQQLLLPCCLRWIAGHQGKIFNAKEIKLRRCQVWVVWGKTKLFSAKYRKESAFTTVGRPLFLIMHIFMTVIVLSLAYMCAPLKDSSHVLHKPHQFEQLDFLGHYKLTLRSVWTALFSEIASVPCQWTNKLGAHVHNRVLTNVAVTTYNGTYLLDVPCICHEVYETQDIHILYNDTLNLTYILSYI